MVNVQLKVMDGGTGIDVDEISSSIESALSSQSVQVDNYSDLTLKVKFVNDNDQDLVLLQLRESETKVKLREKVIHRIGNSITKDVSSESIAMVAHLVHQEAV